MAEPAVATGTSRDLTRLAAWFAIAGFVASMMLGLLLPVYTDEVGWRMQLRAGLDGGIDRMINDICGPNTFAAPPWFMMPFRHVAAFLNSTFPDPLYVRSVGTACALLWAFLMHKLIAQRSADHQQRNILTAWLFALLGMGLLPIMLTMSRPDQLILLTVTAALICGTIAARSDAIRPHRNLWPLLILLLGIAAISSHLKGIVVAPLILACILLAGKGKDWRFRLAPAALFAGLTVQALGYWISRFRCPGDPLLAAGLANENIAAALTGGGGFASVLAFGLPGANPNNYIEIVELRPKVLSNWLPQGLISEAEAIIRYVPMNLAWNALMLISAICLFHALRQRWRERRLDLAVAVPLIAAGLVLVWGFSQRFKNDYEIMFVMPLIALFGLFSLTAIGWTDERKRQMRTAAILLVAISLAGQIDIARRLLPPLFKAAQHPGYIDGQKVSVAAFNYSAIRGPIRQTARMCGIGTRGPAQRPLVDDVTAFAFTDSWRPMHYLGVIGMWRGSIRDPIAHLRSRGSEGLIMGCHLLPPELQAIAIRNGSFCCISTR